MKKPFNIPDDIPIEIIKEKRAKYTECDKQYLFWYLNHPPSVHEYRIIRKLLYESNAKEMYKQKSIIYFRIFFEDDSSIHFKISQKYWGFSINIHRDVFKHKCAIFDKECLTLLSKFYISLSKTMGKPFLLPRQELEFQSHLGKLFHKKKQR